MFIIGKKEKICIVLSDNPTEVDKYSGEELKKYISKSIGKVLPDIKESEEDFSTYDYKIFLGKTNALNDLFSDIYDDLIQDEYCIKVKGNDLYIFGKENVYSSSGTLYGVYGFLEKYLNIRFYSYDEEYVPKTKQLKIDDGEVRSKPDFIIRQPLFASTRRHTDFTAKCRIKDCYCQGTPGGTIYPMWEGLQGHNFYSLISPDEYEKEHPEWFDKENGELCFSREDLTDEIEEKIEKQIKDNPHSKFFALSQNDTVKPCQCEDCKRGYEKYGESGMLVRFVNRVAEKIEDFVKKNYENREVYLVTFAYYFSIKPPVIKTANGYKPIDGSCIPNKNVYVFFTTIDYCFYHNLTDESCEWNKTFKDCFYGWKWLVGDRMMVWNYGINYAHYLYPFYNYKTLKSNFKFFKDNGVKYIIEHGACEGEFVEMQELRTYVTSELLWDTNQSAENLIDEFIDNYYKDGAEDIKKYLKLLEKRFAEIDDMSGYHLRVYHLPESMFSVENFSLEFLKSLFSCFDSAREKISKIEDVKMREMLDKRVMRAYISAKYLFLMNYSKYEIKGKEEFENEFLEDCEYCGIKKHREYWKDEDKIPELIEMSKRNEVLKY